MPPLGQSQSNWLPSSTQNSAKDKPGSSHSTSKESKERNQIKSVLKAINKKYSKSKDEKTILFSKPLIHESHFIGHNVWILKACGFNRGIGIHVFNDLETMKKLIKDYKQGVDMSEVSPSKKKSKLSNAAEKDRDPKSNPGALTDSVLQKDNLQNIEDQLQLQLQISQQQALYQQSIILDPSDPTVLQH